MAVLDRHVGELQGASQIPLHIPIIGPIELGTTYFDDVYKTL